MGSGLRIDVLEYGLPLWTIKFALIHLLVRSVAGFQITRAFLGTTEAGNLEPGCPRAACSSLE